MKEKINIWGKTGCELPNGSLCQACCLALVIPEIPKEELTTCRHQTNDGCGIYTQEHRPGRCATYHCSTDPNTNRRLLLITVAEMGFDKTPSMVTPEQAEEARDRI